MTIRLTCNAWPVSPPQAAVTLGTGASPHSQLPSIDMNLFAQRSSGCSGEHYFGADPVIYYFKQINYPRSSTL
jgi:hypothetical protein